MPFAGLFDHDGVRKTRICSFSGTIRLDTQQAQRKTESFSLSRFARRGAHATVLRSVGVSHCSFAASHCSFAALAHNSLGAAQHFFDSDIGRNRATTPGEFPVMDDVCGSANRVQRPQ
ncbi:hypothetical protein [Bradyrhizobium sp. RDI18]|uniref:hypothetical protein n=1 Tax=Bradyrhizobium sp. RDI18 TaxID=3367400 RepID=UPI003718BF16